MSFKRNNSYNVIIQSFTKKEGLKQQMTGTLTIEYSEFREHDEAAHMFALEFAANNHSELPMRVYIHDK